MQDATMSNDKNITRRGFGVLSASAALSSCAGLYGKKEMPKPILIAHRGASGYRPEHTLESYRLAIEQGCDFIEPDLVITKDGQLICRHENNITETTNVSKIPEFAARKAVKVIDGERHDGWFTEDFTLAEIKTLRCKERLPQLRPQNTKFDEMFEIPTFEEVLKLRETASNTKGREIGIYPETKHPSYFAEASLNYDDELLRLLDKFRMNGFAKPVFIQSFETENLKRLASKTKTRLIQLMSKDDGPWDRQSGYARAYLSMASKEGLEEIAKYAFGIGPEKVMIVAPEGEGFKPTNLVSDAHSAGLKLHPWTFRAENYFMIDTFKTQKGLENAAKYGNLKEEIKTFLKAGIDGLFSDNPDIARAAIDEFLAAR